jgi:hypothetical protein
MGSVYTAKLALARGHVGRAWFGHREPSPLVILNLFQDNEPPSHVAPLGRFGA